MKASPPFYDRSYEHFANQTNARSPRAGFHHSASHQPAGIPRALSSYGFHSYSDATGCDRVTHGAASAEIRAAGEASCHSTAGFASAPSPVRRGVANAGPDYSGAEGRTASRTISHLNFANQCRTKSPPTSPSKGKSMKPCASSIRSGWNQTVPHRSATPTISVLRSCFISSQRRKNGLRPDGKTALQIIPH
jgi:hypothetical protein